MINTIHGLVDEATLSRTVGFEERPNEFVVWVEWRRRRSEDLPALPDGASTEAQLVRAREVQGEIVRRDAHVILKHPTATADALAASLG